MKRIAGCFLLLVLAGCATPDQVQKMIEANNQKIASEQLRPEFDRIDEQLRQTEEALAALQASVSEEQSETASRIRDISLALNKAQADMSIIQDTVVSQQDDVRTARESVEAQREVLLNLFQRQQEHLAEIIGSLDDTEPQPEE